MPSTNRTQEFLSAVESIKLRSVAQENGSKARLLPSTKYKVAARSQFSRAAAAIGKDLQQTTAKLEKLAQRALTALAEIQGC
jgi:syntaxin 5